MERGVPQGPLGKKEICLDPLGPPEMAFVGITWRNPRILQPVVDIPVTKYTHLQPCLRNHINTQQKTSRKREKPTSYTPNPVNHTITSVSIFFPISFSIFGVIFINVLTSDQECNMGLHVGCHVFWQMVENQGGTVLFRRPTVF